MSRHTIIVLSAMLMPLCTLFAHADGGAATAPLATTAAWSVHLQTTFVDQYHPSLAAAYSGNNSLSASANSENTSDATVYLGRRLWHGGEFYFNEEVDHVNADLKLIQFFRDCRFKTDTPPISF